MGKHDVLVHETQSLIVGNAGAIMIAMVSGLEPILPMSGTALDVLAQSGEEHKQLVVAVTTIRVNGRQEAPPVGAVVQWGRRRGVRGHLILTGLLSMRKLQLLVKASFRFALLRFHLLAKELELVRLVTHGFDERACLATNTKKCPYVSQ